MAACRSLLVLHPDDDSYRVSLLRYKSECIQILRAALSASDGREISDYTIALALVLTTEEASISPPIAYRRVRHLTVICLAVSIRKLNGVQIAWRRDS